jgi:hypothetical protein
MSNKDLLNIQIKRIEAEKEKQERNRSGESNNAIKKIKSINMEINALIDKMQKDKERQEWIKTERQERVEVEREESQRRQLEILI